MKEIYNKYNMKSIEKHNCIRLKSIRMDGQTDINQIIKIGSKETLSYI